MEEDGKKPEPPPLMEEEEEEEEEEDNPQNKPSLPPNPFLQILLHPNNTITRPQTPTLPPSITPTLSSQDLTIKINPQTQTLTSLRLYLPQTLIKNNPNPRKLPILLFLHGGGFALFSPSSAPYHLFSSLLSSHLQSLVLSLDYRLAPENPLPAPYLDCLHTLQWLHSSPPPHPWIGQHADLDRVFIFGSSSGANVALNTLLFYQDCPPVKGILLNQPYFGGVDRTASEERSENDPMLPLRANDLLWGLALPEGSDRDHVYCNPMRISFEGVKLPKCWVRGCEGDPLVDRQREFVGWLEGKGVEVEATFEEGGFHAVELFDEEWAMRLVEDARRFVYGDDGGA